LVDVEEASLRENFGFVALVFENPEKMEFTFHRLKLWSIGE
jgi:hypothetical protein